MELEIRVARHHDELYLSQGLEQVGEYEFPVGSTRDRELILRRS